MDAFSLTLAHVADADPTGTSAHGPVEPYPAPQTSQSACIFSPPCDFPDDASLLATRSPAAAVSSEWQRCCVWMLRAMRQLLAACPLPTRPSCTAAGNVLTPPCTAHRLALALLRRCLPVVLERCGMNAVDEALGMLCSCQGASPCAHRLMHCLEQQLQQAAHPPSPALEPPSPTPMPTPDPSRTTCVYLLLLGHMASLYEAERQAFLTAASASGAAPTDLHAVPQPPSTAPLDGATVGPQQDASTASAGDAVVGGPTARAHGPLAVGAAATAAPGASARLGPGFDYMQGEERAAALQAGVQQLVQGLMQRGTAPACRLPFMLAVLEGGSGEAGQATKGGGTQARLQQRAAMPAGATRSAVMASEGTQPEPTLGRDMSRLGNGDDNRKAIAQVLALRALGRLLVLSPPLAVEQQHWVARAVTTPLKAQQQPEEPAHDEDEAMRLNSDDEPDAQQSRSAAPRRLLSGTRRAAERGVPEPHQPARACLPCVVPLDLSAASQQLCSEGLAVAEALLLAWPNTSGCLLQPVQDLVHALLQAAEQEIGHGAGQVQRRDLQQGSREGRGQAGLSGVGERAGSPLQRLPGEGWAGRLPGRPSPLPLLLRVLGSWSRVLEAERLQLAHATWQLLGMCATSSVPQVQALVLCLLRSMLAAPATPAASRSAASSAATAAGGERGDAAAAVGSAGAGARHKLHKGVLALYGSCPPPARQSLVEQVMLGSSGLLGAEDLAMDGLVLPVLQSLAVAECSGARQAAATFLSHMTPSTKALTALAQALPVLGWEAMPTSQARDVLRCLRALVGRAKQQEEKRTAAVPQSDKQRSAQEGRVNAAQILQQLNVVTARQRLGKS
ncbi:hypothetical protein V8C86DRAFT_634709 [Haematococcus lacustris]